MTDLCSFLTRLFPHANYFALDSGVSEWEKVKQAQKITGLSLDEVITTKCRLTADTISYLLSFTPRTGENPEAWWIRLRGYDKYDQGTGVGHAFVVLEGGNGHLLIDSYIGCRGLSCRYVDFDHLTDCISQMEKSYHPDLWKEVTGCYENEPVDHLKVAAVEYMYDPTLTSVKTRMDEMYYHQVKNWFGHKHYNDFFKRNSIF